jgi:HD-GYP domain-containing protein (c-di-GMP phosphodiesterase class II)
MKKERRYYSIDKDVLTEGNTVEFDVYVTNEDKTQMSLFLQSGATISGTDKIRLRELERVYINQEHDLPYREYLEKHLQTIAKNSTLEIERKSALVYEKATETIDEMFKNPESLANVQKAQDTVSGFMDVILHDDFTVESLMKITAHDYYTHTHSINVSVYTLSLGQYVGLSGKELEDLGTSALLHDLGKSKIDTAIINKNGKLSDQEFNEMKSHPMHGYEIAQNLGITDPKILAGIRHHHEKLDATGYPDKIGNEKISLFPKIIGVCDVFDALSTRRSYKDPMSSFASLKLIKDQMSNHLDMKLVNAFIKMIRE